MMYPKWMLRLLFYFDLWGFCTQFRPNQPQFDRFILVLHILLASITTTFISKYVFRPGNDRLGRVNDICKFTVLLLLYWLSIFELYFKRKSQRHFWCIVHYIDKHFCSLQRFDLGFYTLKIKIYLSLSIIANVFFFKRLLTTTLTEYIYFWLCYLFIIWIYQNRSFYYLFYLEWIKHELKRVNHEANEIVATYYSYFLKTNNLFTKKFHRNRFKWLRQYYGSTYDLCDAMNIVFGWSNAVTILGSVHLIVADFNWFYWKLLNKHNPNVIRKTHIKFHQIKKREIKCFSVVILL